MPKPPNLAARLSTLFPESMGLREQNIALGEMRGANMTGLLIYCSDETLSRSCEAIPI